MTRPLTAEEQTLFDELQATETEWRTVARRLVAEAALIMGMAEDEVDLLIETYPIGEHDPNVSAGEQVRAWMEEQHGIDVVYNAAVRNGLMT